MRTNRGLYFILLCAAAFALAWPAADLFAESKSEVIAARTDGPLYYNPVTAEQDGPCGASLVAGDLYRVLDAKNGMLKVKSMRDSRVFWARAADLGV